MKTIKFKKILVTFALFLTVGLFAYGSMQASAAGLWDSQIGSSGSNTIGSWFGSTGTPDDIRVTIYKIINFVINLLGVLFLILTVMAGFQWMVAAGDPKKIETAMGYLKSAIIGLVIVLVSKGLTIFIFQQLLHVTYNTLN